MQLKNRQAFTLIELMVTLGIMAIILGASVPRLFTLQIEEELDQAAQDFSLAVSQAQSRASYPNNLTTADTSRLTAGSNQAGSTFQVYAGTILTIEPDASGGKANKLVLRDWSFDKNSSSSPNIAAVIGPYEISNGGIPPLEQVYPTVETFHLPNQTFVETSGNTFTSPHRCWKYIGGQDVKWTDDPGLACDVYRKDNFLFPYYFVPFLYSQSGRPDATKVLDATQLSNQDPRLIFLIKRNNYAKSCRQVIISLVRGDVSVRRVVPDPNNPNNSDDCTQ